MCVTDGEVESPSKELAEEAAVKQVQIQRPRPTPAPAPLDLRSPSGRPLPF